MKLLAVDTSGPVCGVAILTEDGIRHECAVMNHKTHSVNLLPMIDNAFQSTGLTIQDMDRLAVVVGPGSFTGVRLGVSTVKGLAHGAGKPCVAVNALEAMAALALYSVGRELALWEKAWTLRNALFGLSTLAMLTALLGLPFLYRASQYKMLELEHATYAGIGRPLVMRFLLLLAGETILLGVLVLNVRAAVPWSIGQLLAVLTVPFLTANNELLLLLRWVRPEWMMTGAVPLFAGQMCLLRFVQLSELPKGLPLAAGVLVLCMVLQCIRLAARSEYIAEA